MPIPQGLRSRRGFVDTLASNPVFNPATLPLSLWLKPDYSGSPWTSAASAGTSSGRTSSQGTAPSAPTVGTAVNGHNPAAFSGVIPTSNTYFQTSSYIESDVYTASAATGAVLYKASSTVASGGGPSVDPNFFQGKGSYFSSAINNTGPCVSVFDTGFKSVQLTGFTSGFHLLKWFWDGVTLSVGCDSAAYSTVACGAMGDLTSQFVVGSDASFTNPYNGVIVEIITSKSVLSSTDLDNYKSYINSTYALSL